MKKSSLFPTSAIALRLSAVMHRAPTTAWSEKKEIGHFRKLSKHIQEDDLAMVERYYRVNWPPRTGTNHLRHDLATLINNWSGEVDRARIWCDAHPVKTTPRKIIPLPVEHVTSEPPQSPEELAEFLAQYKRLMGRLPKGYEEQAL